ncbi:cobalamin ABC transporter ATP-binding protein [Mycolicibacterium sp. (ex Dasyatis americana)]|uniref:Cobalamin ABC transporter ATP-binding protein n=1 Tax=Mycobacterium syngnathidarum TaxID=1908205 RepID=A0A1Q9WCT3_9MYCO|nr:MULTISPECIES: ABC transporter ATP-binding protein [Mycobacterium]OFB40757.1 cobalamin ABC transporter ATP-binding protein [Mycolicibacterium sp. (ex Dasyatis americana)]MCG7606958.1 ABC transporter ATP-binding protein [Mycobacterium sp. CnD-18-1]OHU07566.1 cobalamin ABC transporter ATP-binding protein [Mycobacterium syngnathidarum]OLT96499.1 cobalamin ABC transporter ATP-binding protein [Mycobacterium syngnathidarum]TMS55224.1 ABC transporter ATP-binding protein [Mycobacterium sp. DBP42]
MLELDGLGFAYDRERWLFRDVCYQLAPGEILSVLGPNGRGKTTLLRCVVGLAEPSEGRVRADGVIGYVPQSHRSTFAYTAMDMVLMGRVRHLGRMTRPGRRDYRCAQAALERVGIAPLADRDYPSLSGGERQLVLIARAIAAEGQVLVLDEPAAALDLRNQGRVLHLLRGLADEGHGIVLTTHHPDHALEIADTALLLGGGADVRVGPADTLLTDVVVSELYGVRAHSLTLTPTSATDSPRRTIVVRYDQELHP